MKEDQGVAYNDALIKRAQSQGQSRQLEMRLFTHFGIRCTLQMIDERIRIAGRIVGVAENEFLIVRIAAGKNFVKIRDFTPDLIMRFASEGSVYGFRSPVIGTVDLPTMVFLGWPESVEVVALRSHERVRCFIHAQLHVDKQQFSTSIIDLSIGGCRIAMDAQFNAAASGFWPDSKVVIELDIGDGLGTRKIGGVIKSIEDNEGRQRYGVMFDNLDSELSLAVDGMIERLRAFL